jgi:hypothetical protein
MMFMFPCPEPGLCVELSDDGSHVLMTLDRTHAAELARIISLLSSDYGGHSTWMSLARETAGDTWLGTMLRLIACSQNVRAPELLTDRR